MSGDRGRRALGVDVGTVRVGLALSDPTGVVATPLGTLEAGPARKGGRRQGVPSDPQAWVSEMATGLARTAREHGCDTVVIGLPRALSGRDTDSTILARSVADALRVEGLTVELWDERLSSVEAERVLLEAGRRRTDRRTARDRMAAAIILQGWLDARPR